MPYVIKVLDRPAETLCDILKKGEYFFHFRAISNVAVSSERHAPGPSLRAQRCFEAFCEVKGNKLKVNERIFHRELNKNSRLNENCCRVKTQGAARSTFSSRTARGGSVRQAIFASALLCSTACSNFLLIKKGLFVVLVLRHCHKTKPK